MTTPDKDRQDFSDVFVSAPDGLTLHARDYGGSEATGTPVVCLPGLTRSARDFDDIARALSAPESHGRRVIVVEYRGRGRSDHDKDWRNYNVLKELDDLTAILTALDLEHADFIGTSRGGILIMLLAAVRPGAIGAAVLNDVGPVVDVQGLVRIKRMLRDLKPPSSWEDAISTSRRFHAAAFPDIDEAGWEKYARQTYRDDNGHPAIDFDTNIARTLDEFDPESPPPELWPQFVALSAMPTLVIRGALSGILGNDTVEKMRACHPDLDVHVVENQGHAPLLWDTPTQDRIASFLAKHG